MRKVMAGFFLVAGLAGCCLVVMFFVVPQVLPARVAALLGARPGPTGAPPQPLGSAPLPGRESEPAAAAASETSTPPAPEDVEQIIRSAVEQLKQVDEAAVEGMLLAPAPDIEPDDEETPSLAALSLPVVDGEAVLAPHAPAVDMDLSSLYVETPSPAPSVQASMESAARLADPPPEPGCPCPTPVPTAEAVAAALPVTLAAAEPVAVTVPAVSPASPVIVPLRLADRNPEQVEEVPRPTPPVQAPMVAEAQSADLPPVPPAAEPVSPTARPLALQDLSPTPPLRGAMGYRLPMVSRQQVPDQVISGVLVRAHATYVILRPGYWELLQADGGIVVPAREAPPQETTSENAVPPQVEGQGRRWWNPASWFRRQGGE